MATKTPEITTPVLAPTLASPPPTDAPATEESTPLTEKQQSALNSFCNRFAGGKMSRRVIAKAVQDGMTSEEFAVKYGQSATHKRFVKVEYEKLLKALS